MKRFKFLKKYEDRIPVYIFYIQQLFVEYLIHAKYSSRSWGYNSKKN